MLCSASLLQPYTLHWKSPHTPTPCFRITTHTHQHPVSGSPHTHPNTLFQDHHTHTSTLFQDHHTHTPTPCFRITTHTPQHPVSGSPHTHTRDVQCCHVLSQYHLDICSNSDTRDVHVQSMYVCLPYTHTYIL